MATRVVSQTARCKLNPTLGSLSSAKALGMWPCWEGGWGGVSAALSWQVNMLPILSRHIVPAFWTACCVILCLAVSENFLLHAHPAYEKNPKHIFPKARASSLFQVNSAWHSAQQLGMQADESLHSRRSGIVEKCKSQLFCFPQYLSLKKKKKTLRKSFLLYLWLRTSGK